MAAYFHETQPEISTGSDGGLQTLVLMNPGANYIQFSDHQTHNNGNFVFLDPHAPPPTTTQQFVGIPLSNHPPPNPTDNNHNHNNNNISVAALHGFVPGQRVHYNLYNTGDGTPRAQQGLSLTLSSQQQQQQVAQTNLGFGSGADEIRVGSGSTGGSGVSHGVSALLGSKYLKAAQELLDEVVNVNNNHFHDGSKKETSTNKLIGEFSGRDGSSGGDVTAAGKRSAELTTAERQEIQMKKAKLLSMLDEVEQRYRQYHRQMQLVITSFEQAAGMGSARTYTSLALKTISKQFRCLKDAITGQIRAANKSLGEEDSSSAGKMEGSRLKFVDNQLRQQRALQQLGMMQHHHGNAWRPQRGLPERAVSVLRAWLFEHFLHPYPKDSDKHMLAKQTGLTRSQVSNWFINARVRLWKPMVEEMYLEEMKEQDKNNVSSDKTEQNKEDSASNKSTGNQEKSPATENHVLNHHHNAPSISTSVSRNPTGFSLIGSSELDGITQGSPKKPRTNHEMLQSPLINMEFNSNANNNFMGSFGGGQYSLGEITRFETESFGTPRFSGNNGVSLTLGLPHCENLPVSHQSFLPNQNIQLGRRLEMAEPDEFGAMNQSASTPHSSSSAYDSINIQNQRRFVARLLPDFVT